MKMASWSSGALVLGAVAAFASASSHACGACIEDKVAATYDHAVAQRAGVAGDVVVFCDVAGAPALERLLAAAHATRGVKRGSVRVSTAPAALSFVVTPRLRSPQAAVQAIQRAVTPGTTLTIVRLLSAGPAGSR